MNTKQLILCFMLQSFTVYGKDMKDMSINDLLRLAEDVSQIRPDDVHPSDVKFYLYTRNNPNEEFLNAESKLDKSKPVKFLIHGWIENHSKTWYDKMTEEYLKNGDYNVIQIDWERPARSSYISSAINTKLVGKFVGDFILSQNYPLDKVHILGHSLGSHVAGFAGKSIFNSTGTKIARITALDPAGPYFHNNFITENDKLNRNDAEIVVAIHTDAGYYGYDGTIGTLDVFMNGGSRIQPGCLENNLHIEGVGEFIQNSFCSHSRSCYYFIEAINDGKFKCRKCDTWHDIYLNELCTSSQEFSFGGEEVARNLTGLCFVDTNARPPFLTR